MADVDYRVATTTDETILAEILRDAPMAGWVRLLLLREPSYFAADALLGDAVTVVAQRADAPVGLCRLQRLPAWVNGRPMRTGYLAGLRVLPAFRHRLSVLRKGFAALRTLGLEGDIRPVCFTSIADDNTAAKRLLEAGLPKMPVYRPLGHLHTLAFSSRHGRRGDSLRQATIADIPALVAFHSTHAAQWQFAPCLSEDWLLNLGHAQALAIEDFWLCEEQGQLRACVAVWDQRHLKQTVAQSYRAPLGVLRRMYNGYAHVTKRMCLPAPGQTLNQAYLAFFVSSLEAGASLSILREVLWRLRERNIAVGVLGLATSNPLREIMQRALSATVYETCIESVCFVGDPPADIDCRPPQPEAALL